MPSHTSEHSSTPDLRLVFNEAVFDGGGAITIYETESGNLFRSIDMASEVSGFGSDTILINFTDKVGFEDGVHYHIDIAE